MKNFKEYFEEATNPIVTAFQQYLRTQKKFPFAIMVKGHTEPFKYILIRNKNDKAGRPLYRIDFETNRFSDWNEVQHSLKHNRLKPIKEVIENIKGGQFKEPQFLDEEELQTFLNDNIR